jgi:hypothetical protein
MKKKKSTSRLQPWSVIGATQSSICSKITLTGKTLKKPNSKILCIVEKASQIIAGRGFKSMNCTLEQIVVKDGLKLVLKGSKMAENRNDLLEHQGGSVYIVLTDINPYLGQRSEPKINKDQMSLFDDDDGE